MNRPFEIYESKDKIALRRVVFALELLDAVTLSRVSQGVEVKAYGLESKPIVNAGGLFVWLNEDIGKLEKISIEPHTLPYEHVERAASELKLPLTSIELPPRVDYPFTVGITGLRGTLIEDRNRSEPVHDAEVWLRWLDEDGNWHDAPTTSRTTAKGGDFVAILRLAPTDQPKLDTTKSKLTVRLRVKRGDNERGSADLPILLGHIANPSTSNQFIFAWDELEP